MHFKGINWQDVNDAQTKEFLELTLEAQTGMHRCGDEWTAAYENKTLTKEERAAKFKEIEEKIEKYAAMYKKAASLGAL